MTAAMFYFLVRNKRPTTFEEAQDGARNSEGTPLLVSETFSYESEPAESGSGDDRQDTTIKENTKLHDSGSVGIRTRREHLIL